MKWKKLKWTHYFVAEGKNSRNLLLWANTEKTSHFIKTNYFCLSAIKKTMRVPSEISVLRNICMSNSVEFMSYTQPDFNDRRVQENEEGRNTAK